MNGSGQSDRFVVPANPPDKAAAAEAGEERERPGGTRPVKHAPDAVPGQVCQASWAVCAKWRRGIREARFTALLHHVSLERLVMAYRDLSPKAAPGVDGVTWAALRAGPGC
jgi:RNA-directed DNA polymerase